jgi:DNA-binding transcriptional LysR family regulator
MAGEIDVSVGEPCDLAGYPDIVLGKMPARPSAFFCRRGHPLTQLAVVELKDITSFPFAGPRLRQRLSVHFPEASAMGAMTADGQYFEPAIVCASWLAIREIVLRSDVVAARVRALLETPENRNDFTILPISAPWLYAQNSIMWRRDRMLHPALKAFRDAVRRNEAIAMGDTTTIQVAA